MALSVFLGTLPLVGVVGWAALNNNLSFGLLRDGLKAIDSRLVGIDGRLTHIEELVHSLDKRVTVLETRAGVVFGGD